MKTSSEVLAEFTSGLSFEKIPGVVVARAKDCIADTIAAGIFGAHFPWSGKVIDYALRYGAGGACSILGLPDARVYAPYAALANGALAHAFEIDSVGSTGPHPGSVLLPAVLAACEQANASGKTAITAFVAGCEVIFRLGAAARHDPEHLGFHAPGIIGPYGAAVAAGRVFGLNAEQMTHAMGIAGSLSSGLLAFTKSERGSMVKRLHVGRVGESGILAAQLAHDGYTGPETILDGKFGFLDAYCRSGNSVPLTGGLGENWQTLGISLKRYAAHVYAQIPMQLLRELMAAHSFAGGEVKKIIIDGGEKLLSHHNILDPRDILKAQYSVPFCVGLALYRDPDDPKSFDATAVGDEHIRSASRKVETRVRDQRERAAWSAHMTVQLQDGREFSKEGATYKGMPGDPFSSADLRRKFMFLASDYTAAAAEKIFAELQTLEEQTIFSMQR